ncbi:MAG TPA: TonB-dependent receptor [Kofleriaceae bacterium]|nr:TonB-dependent receptor [Kofleriaceae bacterium]
MKLRDWFGNRAVSLTALLVATAGTARAQPSLHMRPAAPRVAQATPASAPPADPGNVPPVDPAAAPPADPGAAPADPNAPPAFDPNAPIADAGGTTGEGETIVITGSRINDPLGKQAPVLSLGREDLERTGLTNVGDILQQLPVSGGALNGKFNSSGNFGFPPDGGGVGAGAVEADLRHLGSKRVLVLVNGVRWVNGSSGSGVAAATDLNTIPLNVVERIEVLEDGASPIYGSDAISGVINIITRKEFSGVSVNAYAGGYQTGDGLLQKYDVTWGSTTEKISMVFGASFVDQHGISSADRAISNSTSPGLENCEVGCSSATPQGRVMFTDPNTGNSLDLSLNKGAVPLFPGNYHVFTNSDRFNFAPFNYIETPSQRISAFSQVTYKLLPNVNVRGLASFTNRKSVNQAAPEPLFIGPEGGNGNRLDTISIDKTNPYNPFGFTFDANTNPFVVTRRPIEAGPRTFEQTVNTWYVSGGFDGHFNTDPDRRFNWDATIAYGVNRAEQRRNNAFNSQKLQEALGPAFQDSDGTWRCGTDAAHPGDPNCVPFNIFGGQGPDGKGTITRAMLAYTTFTEHDVSEQSTVDAVANLTGNLIKLPAGWIAAAVGVEHRRLSGFYEPDSVITLGDGSDVPSTPLSGHYSVNEAYLELRAPLVANKPGAELLDINAAGRISDYSFLDPEVTGKVGLRYKPTTDLVLRGSYGQGFRAPSIGELFSNKSRFDAVLNDPCSDFNKPTTPQEVRDRCIALGVPGNGSYAQANNQISIATGGNRDLQPEKSKSLNISLAYSPKQLQDKPWVDTFDFELAYWDIRLDQAISAVDAQYQIDSCVIGKNDAFCNGITRNPTGVITTFNNQLQNIGGINSRGFDFTAAYRSPRTSIGKFRATSTSSLLLAYEERVPAGTGFVTNNLTGLVSGVPERAFPRLKSNLALTWLFKEFEMTLTTRYISELTEQCRGFTGLANTCSNPDPVDDNNSTNKLPITVYNDFQLIYTPQFDPRLSITAGVNNFTDRDPPNCYSCSLNGFNPATYDIPGVFGYVNAVYHVQ